jgi:hypothetical protein
MAGMLPTMMILRRYVPSADNPLTPNFWFVMSMGLLVGFIVAYPMNWWLVANHLKHGMMTVRPATANAGSGMGAHDHAAMAQMAHTPTTSHMSMTMPEGHPPRPSIAVMTVLSFVALAAGFALAVVLAQGPQRPAGWRTAAASFFGASRQ